VGTTNRRRVIALTTLLAFASIAGTVSAASDPAAIADAVSKLDADHDQATAAVYLLQAGGERAAEQIRRAWPTLSLLGQKRVLPALSRLAEEHAAALEVLIEAARSEDEDLRDRAFDALRRGSAHGRDAFVALLADPAVGDRAASWLARTQPDFAITPLLEAMSDAGGAERPGLRGALGTAVQRARNDAEPELRDWLAKGPPAEAVASAAMGLVGLEAHDGLITSFIEYAALKATDFSTKWRLLRSAKAAAQSDATDRWVRSQINSPKEWMLRQAAVDALTARGRREDVRASLKDPYPRVRARAATALSGDSETLLARAELARRDPWPMVRAAGVMSLRTERDAIAVIAASVDDSMSLVRTAAIEVLTGSSHEDGWDRIQRRLRARDEWPQVTAVAIEYVVAHCRTEAAEDLFRIVMRAAPSNALTEDLNNAARAIEALRALGSPEAVATIEQLRSTAEVPPTLKIALEQPPAEDGGCFGAAR